MASNFSNIEIICLESNAFNALIDEVVSRVRQENNVLSSRWISDEEAMDILKISSRSTLQNYRDNGKIRFTQPSKKVILYDRNSIIDLLENNAKDTF